MDVILCLCGFKVQVQLLLTIIEADPNQLTTYLIKTDTTNRAVSSCTHHHSDIIRSQGGVHFSNSYLDRDDDNYIQTKMSILDSYSPFSTLDCMSHIT